MIFRHIFGYMLASTSVKAIPAKIAPLPCDNHIFEVPSHGKMNKKHIKKDVEFAMIGASNAAVTGNATTAREMASADQLIADGVTTAGGSAALTEAKITANHQAVFEAGGDPSILFVNSADYLIVSGFTGASGRSR